MKGIIYKIYDNTNGNVYYGSTTKELNFRISKHNSKYKRYLNGKCGCCKSFEILSNNDYTCSVVEVVECETKYDLHTRERFYIENNECVNKCIPNRSAKENKDYQKLYYEKNKETIKEKNKEHYEFNKEKKKEYQEKNKDIIKEKKKIYRENNKEKLKEKKKEYYEINKEKLKEYNKQYRENKKKELQKTICVEGE